MKGFCRTWYELTNADGHSLAISGENSFLTEELAAQAAAGVAVEYRDTVSVTEHTTTIKRIFHVKIEATEV